MLQPWHQSLLPPLLQENLLGALYNQVQKGTTSATALERAFQDTNNDLRKIRSAYFCGSTATTVILDGLRIVCANTGDSPAFIVGKSGKHVLGRLNTVWVAV